MENLTATSTREEYLAAYESLLGEFGVQGITPKWMKEHGIGNKYENGLRRFSLSSEGVAQHFDVLEALKQHRHEIRSKGNHYVKWTEVKVRETAQHLIEEHGFIPSVEWLQQNELWGFSDAIRNRFGGIEAYRSKFGVSGEIKLNVSRANLILDSFAECCFSNFLWARKIEHSKGKRYPPEYSQFSGKALGRYDIEFVATKENFAGKLISVEIWGGSTTGHRKIEYEETKQAKIAFHKDNLNFLSMSYIDCYDEDKLIEILSPYLADMSVLQLEKDHDSKFVSSQLTLADSVLQRCQFVIDHIEGGILPGTNWFARLPPYENRITEDWEPKTYGNIVEHLQKLGGIRKIRDILGQSEHNMSDWTAAKVIRALADFWIDHNKWPVTIKGDINKIPFESRSVEEINLCNLAKNLCHLTERYIGTYEAAYEQVNELLPHASRYVKPVRILPVGVRQSWTNTFVAKIKINGKSVQLGKFDNPEDASECYKEAKDRKLRKLPVL